MPLMKLEDFKSQPSIVEYLILYLTSSCCIVVCVAAFFGQLHDFWAFLSIAVLVICFAILQMCKSSRVKRAQQFYLEWLTQLDEKEVGKLRLRLKANSPEQSLIRRIVK